MGRGGAVNALSKGMSQPVEADLFLLKPGQPECG